MQDGRTHCKMGCRHPPLCTKPGGDSRQSFQEKFVEGGEARHPSPDLEASQDFWSVLGDDMILQNHVAPMTKLFVPKYDFPISSELYGCSETNKKPALTYFKRRPSMVIATWTAISHCPNFASVWHDFSLLDKVHQKGICGFKADWRRNRSQQGFGHFWPADWTKYGKQFTV